MPWSNILYLRSQKVVQADKITKKQKHVLFTTPLKRQSTISAMMNMQIGRPATLTGQLSALVIDTLKIIFLSTI